ncbi:MAG: hypothetical protein PHW25_05325 [Zoogloea sp.]|uniref:hypothetical protein n=1 Tax=Zoogloea sp. TaxID=49181 RepID=UPI002618A518|nr:hypothetical protein [Zoogloea sp.]MDD3326491.1 hypothetical protein [Zoogloea sp.]
MAETRVDTGVPAKVTTSHSDGKPRHIPSAESDALAKRIAELVGDKKVSWFAKECGFGESLLRKYLAGAQPNTSNLVAMAHVGGVTVDWLATGRPPKTRAELRAGSGTAPEPVLDLTRLQLAIATVEEGLAATRRVMAPEKKAELVLAVYDLYQEPANTRDRVLKLVKSAA